MSSKQGKILGIDLGDRWVGLAISDSARLLARPLTTVAAPELRSFLTDLVQREVISTVVVGHPQTMGGGKSQQTLSVETWFQHLQKAFPEQQWILWDERLSSQRAAQSGKTTTRAAKLRQHAVAAAFILELYLIFQSRIRADDEIGH